MFIFIVSIYSILAPSALLGRNMPIINWLQQDCTLGMQAMADEILLKYNIVQKKSSVELLRVDTTTVKTWCKRNLLLYPHIQLYYVFTTAFTFLVEIQISNPNFTVSHLTF